MFKLTRQTFICYKYVDDIKFINYTINDSLNDFQNSAETCSYEQILKLNTFNFEFNDTNKEYSYLHPY